MLRIAHSTQCIPPRVRATGIHQSFNLSFTLPVLRSETALFANGWDTCYHCNIYWDIHPTEERGTTLYCKVFTETLSLCKALANRQLRVQQHRQLWWGTPEQMLVCSSQSQRQVREWTGNGKKDHTKVLTSDISPFWVHRTFFFSKNYLGICFL